MDVQALHTQGGYRKNPTFIIFVGNIAFPLLSYFFICPLKPELL